MSTDFRKVLVKDDRLMVSDTVNFAVLKGGQNMTCQRFNAIGSGPYTSAINFNIQIPSQETIIARNALISTTLTFTIQGNTINPVANENKSVYENEAAEYQQGLGFLFAYGSVDSFGPLVFNQLISSQQWTINNTTCSQNTRDILAVLLRIHDRRWLSRYNGLTPTAFDVYATNAFDVANNQWTQAVLNNPSAGFYGCSMDNDLMPRGAFPLNSMTVVTTADPPVASFNYVNPSVERKVTVTISVTEPILVSPWVYSGDDSCGMYGIQNLSCVINLDKSANTAIRFGNTAARFAVLPTVAFVQADTPQLLLQLLTPHASDLFPSRNVMPYYELPRYYTQIADAINPGTATSVSSQNLQFNMIPDKIILAIGIPATGRNSGQADSFMTITGVSINWNNNSGILSSATPQDLWRMSVENGSNQSWLEFSGKAGSTARAENESLTVSTCGSVLILEMGKDIQLIEDYYAPGSLGNFNFYITVNYINNTGITYAPNSLNLITVLQNSGVFSIERGVSSSYLGIITKSDVIEASKQEASGYSSSLRMVGGKENPSMFSRLKAGLGKLSRGSGMSSGEGYSGGKKSKKQSNMGSLEDRL
jgi:hypothetical protein